MAGKNAFDELLASISETPDREALTGLAAKYPSLKESVMMRSDYSKKQDELRTQVELADRWNKWRQENYVEDALGPGRGATKRELEALKRAQELETKLTEGSGEVDFNTFNSYLEKAAKERGIVTQDVLDQKINERASGVQQTVDQALLGHYHVATKGMTLGFRHMKDFQEALDLDDLVKYGHKNGFNDLEKAYDAYTGEKREEIRKAEVQRQIDEARKQGAEEKAKELAAQNPGQMPTDDGSPDMGHFERRIRGLDKTEGGDKLPELGRGGIASIAAREWNSDASK